MIIVSYSELPPALPYIGAYLDIIYTMEMQSKTYNHNGLVNFAKMTKLAEMVTTVLQYQDVGFNFEPKPDVSLVSYNHLSVLLILSVCPVHLSICCLLLSICRPSPHWFL